MNNRQKYTFIVEVYNSASVIQTNCIDFSVFNAGDGIITINNFDIAPGQSFGLNGNVGEIITDVLYLSFAAGATIQKAQIVKRVYQ